MRKIVLLLIIIFILVAGCSTSKEEVVEVNKISVAEVNKIIDNYEELTDIYIIDVRTEDEFLLGHIKGAQNVALANIELLELDKNSKIILYCQSGRRSEEAAKTLIELGYNQVYDMGGINDWPYGLVYE